MSSWLILIMDQFMIRKHFMHNTFMGSGFRNYPRRRRKLSWEQNCNDCEIYELRFSLMQCVSIFDSNSKRSSLPHNYLLIIKPGEWKFKMDHRFIHPSSTENGIDHVLSASIARSISYSSSNIPCFDSINYQLDLI